MAKLCPRGKQQQKENSRYTQVRMPNMYASAVCSGKVTPGGRKNKAMGGSINSVSQERKARSNYNQGGVAKGCGGVMNNRRKVTKKY
jgi:hypothetical protein